MTRTLILAASLGLSVSAASACDYMRSAQNEASKTDNTVVASTATEVTLPISYPSSPSTEQASSQKAVPTGD